MSCMLCRTNLIEGNVNHIVNFDGHIIIVKGVPANICKKCGEYYIENSVALRLEKTIKEAKENNTEMLIINYSEISA